MILMVPNLRTGNLPSSLVWWQEIKPDFEEKLVGDGGAGDPRLPGHLTPDICQSLKQCVDGGQSRTWARPPQEQQSSSL